MVSMSTDFMASCRHSVPRIILIPKELCHPAAPAVWCLPLRTAWSPRPWVKPVLMFSTEPSQHTQASQCTICLQLPQASLGNLFAVALKTPRSCSSVLWTAVLASSPLCIPKAESSRGSAHLGPLSNSSPLIFILSQAV
ncbi:mCG13334 [Mus musculus]|nr:mCG13334 [Mus musculus]